MPRGASQLSLALFVLGIAATDNPNDSSPPDDLAVLTDRLDATSNLHLSCPSSFLAELVMIVKESLPYKASRGRLAQVTPAPLPAPP